MKALKHSTNALILLTAIRTAKSAGDSTVHGYASTSTSEAGHYDEDAEGPGLSDEGGKSVETLVSSLERDRRLFMYAPEAQCVDTKLKPNEELKITPEDGFNSATYGCICPHKLSWAEDYRLCIEPWEGRLVLYNPSNDEIWSSDPNNDAATRVRVQGGEVLLLDGDDTVGSMNPPGCVAPQSSQLEFRRTGIFMVDENNNVKWYLNFQGVMSGCDPDPDTFPEDPCVDVVDDPRDDECRMIAFNTETGNYQQALMVIKKLNNGKFKVTDWKKKIWFRRDKYDRRWRRKGPTSFRASFSKSGGLLVDGQERGYSCQSIADGGFFYVADDYYTFYEDYSHYCSSFGNNLVKVMIQEYDSDDGPWDNISDGR